MKDTIVQVGNPVLHEIAKPVHKQEFGGKKLHALIVKMSRALAKEEFGVAIAAPQVNESLRLFVVAGRAFVAGEKDADEKIIPPDMVFINPTLTRLSRKTKEMSEGCLSVRGKYGSVIRHERASIKAFNEHGKSFTYHSTGLIAHIFQHECDHLDGILYIEIAEQLQDDKPAE